MRNTYTSKPTSKRNTHTIRRIFGVFPTSIIKNTFRRTNKRM